MPYVGPEGVTQDYYNYITSLRIVSDWMQAGIEGMNTFLRDTPIPLYTEVYPPEKYENVVNSYNRENVIRLENLVRELNALGKAGKLTMERWRIIDSQIIRILYGDRD